MKVFIPSLGRADMLMERGTVANLPQRERIQHTYLVCQHHERKAYEKVCDKWGTNLMVLDKKIKRIVPTRHMIGQVCEKEGFDKFMMLDDDLEFYIRQRQWEQTDDWWKLTVPSGAELSKLFHLMSDDLDTVEHVGISGREGNNRVREAWVYNTRYMRALGYQTDAYLACEHNRVQVMEDFDIALQMLKQGWQCKVWYEYAQGQTKTQAAGGCSVWRTHKVHNAGAERLAKLHPGFVRVREKQNKTDREGFGTRKEVTVLWKKAYESSQEKEK
ncbi:glucosyl transferase [Alphaproteobacteria phage PhiJL001]|uniref:Glucosyl transferase n=1 Tax=Alphaproteobacteria phage PhiJL001 TaxID=2681607 RepID=Q5DN83_9CAUD|nr:beta-glucosyl-HMC-alpha-glucosyltransferase [Alphaproteobacteria phage PhiJL001]AAT69498.1 glucosyl transferase [Alphaproteobacteria phage PhiJL001]